MHRLGTRQASPTWTTQRVGKAYCVNVLPRTEFLPDLATLKAVEIPLAVGIWSTDWLSGVLSVKYSSRTAWLTATTKVEVVVQNVAIIPEEPQTTFVEATTIVATSTWLQSTPGTNRLETVAFAAPIGPQLRVLFRATNNHGSAQVVGVTLSVDLIGRPG